MNIQHGQVFRYKVILPLSNLMFNHSLQTVVTTTRLHYVQSLYLTTM